MSDFRALCAELLSEIDAGRAAVLNRVTVKLRAALGEPEGEGPSDQELASFLVDQHRARMASESAFGCPDFDGAKARAARIVDARAVLARWGHPAASAVEPIPVSERLPEDADCLVIPPHGTSTFPLSYCWQAREIMHCGQARLIWDWKLVPHTTERDWPFSYWLPASTRFLPTTVDSDQLT